MGQWRNEGPDVIVPFTHLTRADIPRNAVAVIPLGAVETHGPHLPLGTDSLIAEGFLDSAATLDQSNANFVRLPLMWLGASAEHGDVPGTLSAEPEQVIAQIVSVGDGLARAGLTRVMLFNAHGGNIAAASIAALKLRAKLNMLAASVHWLDFGLPASITPPSPLVEDVHGGWMETSILLHLAPQLVKKDAVAARAPSPPAPSLFPKGPVNWGWKIDDLAAKDGKSGWIGRPDLATAALGKAIIDHAAQKLVAALHDLSAAKWP